MLTKLATIRKWYLHICILGAGLVTWGINLAQYNRSGAKVFFGDDTYAHLQIIANLANGQAHVSLSLPVLFQQTALSISRLFHTDPVSTYTQLAILSYPFMVIAIGYAGYFVFKKPIIGVLAALCLAFVSIQPLQTYQDGTIPNIYAIGVIFPLFLIGISQLSKKRRMWFGGLLALISFILLFLTHHLSTLIALTSLSTAAILSTIWIAFWAPKRWRPLFFIPALFVIVAILGVIFVIKPSALFDLVKLFATFHSTYPWVTFITSTGVHAPWDAIRFGRELGGIVFQLGIVGIFLVWFELRNVRRYSEVFPQLVITTWCLIYWLGSLTSLSGEPDRLARDLALPASILAAYTLWWVVNRLWQAYRPLAIAVITVTIVASTITGIQRYSFATSTPDYLYGTIDQQVYTADVGYGVGLGIYSPNFYWASIEEARGINPTVLRSAVAVQGFLQSGGTCVLQFSYKEVIAGGIIDPRFAEPVITSGNYTTQRFEDSKKIIWRFCQTSIKPIANVSQNT